MHCCVFRVTRSLNDLLNTLQQNGRSLTIVYALMFLQIPLLSECLITHVAAKWPLTTVYALMFPQIPLLSKCLTTHLTAKWPLTTMYVLMFLQIPLLSE
jgi:hypothetical protein